MGGEATIWLGSYDGKEIAIREIHLPEEGWSSPAGQRTLKARMHRKDTTFRTSYCSIFQVILREIVTHWQLHHPNILTLFGVFREVDSDPPMMVLPFVPHGSALGWLKSNNTPECFLNIARIHSFNYHVEELTP
jgi:serine/threonine protein kinase